MNPLSFFRRRGKGPVVRHRLSLAVLVAAGAALVPSVPALVTLGTGLAVVGLTGEAIAATSYYIDANASAAGTGTALSPFKYSDDLPSLAGASNVDIYISGQLRTSTGASSSIDASTCTNVWFRQMPGMPQGDVRGDIRIGTGFVNTSGSIWRKNIGAGLVGGGGSQALTLVAFKYDASVDASGRHFGHLSYVAGAGASGQYDYNDTTGDLDINVPSSPNGSTADVVYQNLGDFVGIKFTAGSGNGVEGLYFTLFCGAQVYPYRFDHSPNCQSVGNTERDSGEHSGSVINSTGTTGNGTRFYGNTYMGGQANWNPVVFYQQDPADGTIKGSGVHGCTFHFYRYLGIDGAVRPGQSDSSQIGVYCHGDSGTTASDIQVTECNFINYTGEDRATPVDGANIGVPTDLWDYNTYPVRMDRCTLTNFASFKISNYLAAKRCRFFMTRAGPSGLCRTAGSLGTIGFNSTGTKHWLLDACEIISDGTDAGNSTSLFMVWATGHNIRRLNCSVHELSLQADGSGKIMEDYQSQTAAFMRARGTAFSFAIAGNNVFCWQDATTDAAHHDYVDCVYYNPGGLYSQNGSFDAQAEWLASVDTSAKFLSAVPYVAPSTSLSLTPASALWVMRRASSALIPDAGINGPYNRMFGAYQYGASTFMDRLKRVSRAA